MPAYLLTLAAANMAYRLDDLIKAINSIEKSSFREMLIQADFNNTEAVLGGDASIAETRYGYTLTKDLPPRLYHSEQSNVGTLDKYFLCVGTAGQKISVELVQ